MIDIGDRDPAWLVLEDGRIFPGRAYGSRGVTLGEAVFATGMTGYQETLTDPSYHRQIVVQTAPHIGNTGVNSQDPESRRIWVSGYVVRDPSPVASSWRADGTLEPELVANDVVGICDVDTRALTRHLRDRGAMRAGIFPAGEPESALARVLAAPRMVGRNLTDEVSTSQPYVVEAVGETRYTVAAVDLGIKAMTPRRMAERGVRVLVLPVSVSAEELLNVGADGYFLSNGPGDPAVADHCVELASAVLAADRPLFGICFGHQVLGRALGLGTYKLPFGHRGINQPVRDRETGRVEITAHNHGFAVRASEESFQTPFGPAEVSHVCLNDDVVEGIRLSSGRAFGVQYHPEAAAGPHDSVYLFDRFRDVMGGKRHATA